MSVVEQVSGRRRDALSAKGIVAVAIDILDAEGEDALTFRALAGRLSTGAGAIYHHVANKDELLEAAAAEVVAGAVGVRQSPRASDVRALMLAVFDLIDGHPWLGPQLARAPWQEAVLLIFEAVGECLAAGSVPERHRFEVDSALVHYVLGAAGQHAAGTRISRGRADLLQAVAADWTTRAAREDFPFVLAVAGQLADHDDRQQFLAGVDLILAGAAAIPRP